MEGVHGGIAGEVVGEAYAVAQLRELRLLLDPVHGVAYEVPHAGHGRAHQEFALMRLTQSLELSVTS